MLTVYRYDMEDAMILNKSSVERGMFHGQIYQVKYLTQLIKLSGFECIIVKIGRAHV